MSKSRMGEGGLFYMPLYSATLLSSLVKSQVFYTFPSNCPIAQFETKFLIAQGCRSAGEEGIIKRRECGKNRAFVNTDFPPLFLLVCLVKKMKRVEGGKPRRIMMDVSWSETEAYQKNLWRCVSVSPCDLLF